MPGSYAPQVDEKTLSLGEGPGLNQPTAIDLFAGCGGMSLGLKNAGFKILYANEINRSAAATYRHNFPGVPLEVRDIRRVSAKGLYKRLGKPRVDVLAAGTPCQGFSVAGKRKAEDSRNQLYKEVLRFAKAVHPRFIVLENVAGMLARRNRGIARDVVKGLRKIGYHPRMKVLTASHFGVPQRRKRVFVIAGAEAIPRSELFPKGKGETVSVSAAIADLAFLRSGENACEYRLAPRTAYQQRMREGSEALCNHQSTEHSARIQRRFRSILPGKRHPTWGATRKQTHFRLHPYRLSNTLTSIPEDSIHYRQSRGLTVREMARLQSFPDSFEFLGPRTTGGERRKHESPQYTQVANAVPPLMAGAVFRKLMPLLAAPGKGPLSGGDNRDGSSRFGLQLAIERFYLPSHKRAL